MERVFLFSEQPSPLTQEGEIKARRWNNQGQAKEKSENQQEARYPQGN